MERWVGKIGVVTGASAGTGAAIAMELARQGLTVVGVARRVEKVEQLQSQLEGAQGKIIPFKCDVSKEEDIKNLFVKIKKDYGTIHLLVNNAGFLKSGYLLEGEMSDWQKMLDVNVLGLAGCAKEAVSLMRATGVDDGQIINLCGMSGHRVPGISSPICNMYSPSKFAVNAISETLRLELRFFNSKIKVTNLSPGKVKSEFLEASLAHITDPKELPSKAYYDRPALNPEDVAASVVLILSAPLHVQIHELTMTSI